MAAFPPLSISSSLPPSVLAQSQGEQINLDAAVRQDGGFHSVSGVVKQRTRLFQSEGCEWVCRLHCFYSSRVVLLL